MRNLTPDELSHLRDRRDRESRSLKRVIRWGIAGSIVYVAVGIALMPFLAGLFPESTLDAIMIIGLFEVFVAAVPALYFRDRYVAHERAVRALEVQLQDPSVRQFTGIFSRDPLKILNDEPALEALLEREFIDLNDAGPHVLELFLKRDILYRVNDRYMDGIEPISIQVIAPRPDNAPAYAVPDSWFSQEMESPQIERRRLSDDEAGELRGFVSRTKRMLTMGLTLTPLMILYFAAVTAERTKPWIGVAIGIVAGAFVVWHSLKLLTLIRRLRADLKENWVLIGAPDNATPYDPRKQAHEQEYVEILASSGIPWTLNGLPASWRGRKM